MEATDGILTVSLHQIQASLNSGESTSYVQELKVHDTGHGIDPADLDIMFDPFFTPKEFGWRVEILIKGQGKTHPV